MCSAVSSSTLAPLISMNDVVRDGFCLDSLSRHDARPDSRHLRHATDLDRRRQPLDIFSFALTTEDRVVLQ